MIKRLNLLVIFAIFALQIPSGCYEKDLDPNDAAGSFKIAREPYDDGNYEIGLGKLGEFKSRFPYSQFAALAELFIANSHFELGQYEEAAVNYEQFIKLHPKHPEVEFAMFRVGECYWADAPEEIDRDQELTRRAIDEWEKLIAQKPKSPFTVKAKEFVEIGHRRIAENMEFVAKFYCRQDIFHACAFRALELADAYVRFNEIRQSALKLAVLALGKVAEGKAKQPDSDKNIYYQNLTVEQIRAKADAAKALLTK